MTTQLKAATTLAAPATDKTIRFRPRKPRAAASARPKLPDDEQSLVGLAGEMSPGDCLLLVRIIQRVAELERTEGEDVALAMLERAMGTVNARSGHN
jgi:hypothetical protein